MDREQVAIAAAFWHIGKGTLEIAEILFGVVRAKHSEHIVYSSLDAIKAARRRLAA